MSFSIFPSFCLSQFSLFQLIFCILLLYFQSRTPLVKILKAQGTPVYRQKASDFFPIPITATTLKVLQCRPIEFGTEASMLTHAPHRVFLFRVFCVGFQKGWVWKPLPRPRCRARTAEPEFFSEQGHMNLYLWCYIVPWTECNNRHKYYHNNPHNSEFMDILAG